MIDYKNNCLDKCGIDNEVLDESLFIVVQRDALGYEQEGALSFLASTLLD